MLDRKIRLKFKGSIPAHLEFALVHRFGFTYYSRKGEEWVMYYKNPNQEKWSHGLSEACIKDLEKRVRMITNAFVDPDNHKDLIKARAMDLAEKLAPMQAAWVKGWVRHVVDEEDEDLGTYAPWEPLPGEFNLDEDRSSAYE